MTDWNRVNFFSPTEFVDDVNKVDPRLFYTLDNFRITLDKRIYPSPVRGSCVREDMASSYSRHYSVGRMSDAIDVFCEAEPAEVWKIALGCRLWGGIGVYFDTHFKDRPWTMFHFDMRPQSKVGPTIWTRVSGSYLKPHKKTNDLKVTMEYLSRSKI